ncbi:MAG TPA: lysyl oxidase family protein [Myxococcaceae bacterium]|nr:lysyl oxidase family protein [Myxococcaceae bacterium]
MKRCRAFVWVGLMSMLGGCPGGGEEPLPDEGPFLSDEPLWTLEAPEALRQSCFGSSIVLGDLNGDGRKDLVVAAPPCLTNPGKGHVAIYPGAESYFASEPIIAEMDWQHPNTRLTGRSMVVSLGHVNGDGYADLLVHSRAGVLVFAGKEDLSTMLQAPLFRVPATGTSRGAFLSDFNGDGLDDLVSLQLPIASVRTATPGAAEPFTLARTLEATGLVRSGDTNGDGLGDLLLTHANGSLLFLGCKEEQEGVCEAGLAAQPSWSAGETVTGFFPDVNGDGRAEVLVNDPGRVRLHLFEPQGGMSAAPVWMMLGDAAYPVFGGTPLFVGDLDQDNRKTEFLLGAVGRLYAFFPEKEVSAELRAGWAWPRSDAIGSKFQGFARYAAVAAGDLNRDGYDDLLAGLSPPLDTLAPTNIARVGKVVAFGGGKVPPQSAAPFLMEPRECGQGGDGKPDVTVDGDVLARTLYVDRRSFDAGSCEVVEGCVLGTGERKLLRFSVSIPNLGSGSVTIPSPEQAPELYQFDACHQHDHLVGFARYELLNPEGSVATVGRKQGFYMVDMAPYCGDAGPATYPMDGSQSISPGWADVYSADYSCQWLDITDVPDGTYSLRVAVDENDLIDEQDTLPNFAEVRVKIAGDGVEFVK